MQQFLIPPYIYFQGRNLENGNFSAILPKTVSKTFMTRKKDFNFSYYKMVWWCRGILTDFLHRKSGGVKKRTPASDPGSRPPPADHRQQNGRRKHDIIMAVISQMHPNSNKTRPDKRPIWKNKINIFPGTKSRPFRPLP